MPPPVLRSWGAGFRWLPSEYLVAARFLGVESIDPFEDLDRASPSFREPISLRRAVLHQSRFGELSEVKRDEGRIIQVSRFQRLGERALPLPQSA